MAETDTETLQNGTGGLSAEEEDERMKQRPADIDADVREMERRKRVEALMSSRLFREELERVLDQQSHEGADAPLLQRIKEMVGGRLHTGSLRGPSCVLPINDIRGIEGFGYEKGEKILRCKLAAVYRLVDLFGWTQSGVGSQITARLNTAVEQVLTTPRGMLPHEVTASSLVKVDMQGAVQDQGTTNFPVNVAGFSIHASVHAARPDVRCVLHIRSAPALAVSAMKQGLLPLCTEACLLGDVAYHHVPAGILDNEERDKLVRVLGPTAKILFLTSGGALCCGETLEEAFYQARNLITACEVQLRVAALPVDSLHVLDVDVRKQIYDASRKPPADGVKWRVGGEEFEALMRMLDNAGFRTGYIYRHPLVKNDVPKPKNDVEVPPAVSSLGYLLEEEEMYKQGLWKKGQGKVGERTRWLNSPNVYQKVEVLETGTTDPKKITKWVDANNEEWVQDGSPAHSSTPVKIDTLQFVPMKTNPKEFKALQQQIKDNRRADKISAGPQSHILEGVTWHEASKMAAEDATTTHTGDHVVLMGAASKGIIQRGYQHNATMYSAPYARNPFDHVTDREIDEYKRVVERRQRTGDYDTDLSESEAISAAQMTSPASAPSETEEESRDEHRVLRIETKSVPIRSQPEVVLSDVDTTDFLHAERAHADRTKVGRDPNLLSDDEVFLESGASSATSSAAVPVTSQHVVTSHVVVRQHRVAVQESVVRGIKPRSLDATNAALTANKRSHNDYPRNSNFDNILKRYDTQNDSEKVHPKCKVSLNSRLANDDNNMQFDALEVYQSLSRSSLYSIPSIEWDGKCRADYAFKTRSLPRHSRRARGNLYRTRSHAGFVNNFIKDPEPKHFHLPKCKSCGATNSSYVWELSKEDLNSKCSRRRRESLYASVDNIQQKCIEYGLDDTIKPDCDVVKIEAKDVPVYKVDKVDIDAEFVDSQEFNEDCYIGEMANSFSSDNQTVIEKTPNISIVSDENTEKVDAVEEIAKISYDKVIDDLKDEFVAIPDTCEAECVEVENIPVDDDNSVENIQGDYLNFSDEMEFERAVYESPVKDLVVKDIRDYSVPINFYCDDFGKEHGSPRKSPQKRELKKACVLEPIMEESKGFYSDESLVVQTSSGNVNVDTESEGTIVDSERLACEVLDLVIAEIEEVIFATTYDINMSGNVEEMCAGYMDNCITSALADGTEINVVIKESLADDVNDVNEDEPLNNLLNAEDKTKITCQETIVANSDAITNEEQTIPSKPIEADNVDDGVSIVPIYPVSDENSSETIPSEIILTKVLETTNSDNVLEADYSNEMKNSKNVDVVVSDLKSEVVVSDDIHKIMSDSIEEMEEQITNINILQIGPASEMIDVSSVLSSVDETTHFNSESETKQATISTTIKDKLKETIITEQNITDILDKKLKTQEAIYSQVNNFDIEMPVIGDDSMSVEQKTEVVENHAPEFVEEISTIFEKEIKEEPSVLDDDKKSIAKVSIASVYSFASSGFEVPSFNSTIEFEKMEVVTEIIGILLDRFISETDKLGHDLCESINYITPQRNIKLFDEDTNDDGLIEENNVYPEIMEQIKEDTNDYPKIIERNKEDTKVNEDVTENVNETFSITKMIQELEEQVIGLSDTDITNNSDLDLRRQSEKIVEGVIYHLLENSFFILASKEKTGNAKKCKKVVTVVDIEDILFTAKSLWEASSLFDTPKCTVKSADSNLMNPNQLIFETIIDPDTILPSISPYEENFLSFTRSPLKNNLILYPEDEFVPPSLEVISSLYKLAIESEESEPIPSIDQMPETIKTVISTVLDDEDDDDKILNDEKKSPENIMEELNILASDLVVDEKFVISSILDDGDDDGILNDVDKKSPENIMEEHNILVSDLMDDEKFVISTALNDDDEILNDEDKKSPENIMEELNILASDLVDYEKLVISTVLNDDDDEILNDEDKKSPEITMEKQNIVASTLADGEKLKESGVVQPDNCEAVDDSKHIFEILPFCEHSPDNSNIEITDVNSRMNENNDSQVVYDFMNSILYELLECSQELNAKADDTDLEETYNVQNEENLNDSLDLNETFSVNVADETFEVCHNVDYDESSSVADEILKDMLDNHSSKDDHDELDQVRNQVQEYHRDSVIDDRTYVFDKERMNTAFFGDISFSHNNRFSSPVKENSGVFDVCNESPIRNSTFAGDDLSVLYEKDRNIESPFVKQAPVISMSQSLHSGGMRFWVSFDDSITTSTSDKPTYRSARRRDENTIPSFITFRENREGGDQELRDSWDESGPSKYWDCDQGAVKRVSVLCEEMSDSFVTAYASKTDSFNTCESLLQTTTQGPPMETVNEAEEPQKRLLYDTRVELQSKEYQNKRKYSSWPPFEESLFYRIISKFRMSESFDPNDLDYLENSL